MTKIAKLSIKADDSIFDFNLFEMTPRNKGNFLDKIEDNGIIDFKVNKIQTSQIKGLFKALAFRESVEAQIKFEDKSNITVPVFLEKIEFSVPEGEEEKEMSKIGLMITGNPKW